MGDWFSNCRGSAQTCANHITITTIISATAAGAAELQQN
jgi:hypothetical protein